jgi:hypothetical protein
MNPTKLTIIGLIPVCFVTLLLSGCDSDEEDAGIGIGLGTTKGPGNQFDDSSLGQGQLIDSPVEGVSFVAGKQFGVTDTQGTFRFDPGDSVRFSIGDVRLGETRATSIITPVELVRGASDETHPFVTNLAQFLQTLDDDAEPTNGIKIVEAVRTSAAGKSIDFAQSVPEFSADGNVQTVVAELTALTEAGPRELVSAQAARDHLRDSLLEIYSGSYSATLTGDDTGSFTFSANIQGSISGSGLSERIGFFNLGGSISSDGSVSFAAGNSFAAVKFVGEISRAGELFGNWEDQFTGTRGEFNGVQDGSAAQEADSNEDEGFEF